MEMSPERIEMLFKELEGLRDKMSDALRFQGKVEGSVRVLHFFVTLGTGALIAFSVVMYNASVSLHGLENKMADFNPVKIELMYNDIVNLKSDVNDLKQHQQTPIIPMRRGH